MRTFPARRPSVPSVAIGIAITALVAGVSAFVIFLLLGGESMHYELSADALVVDVQVGVLDDGWQAPRAGLSARSHVLVGGVRTFGTAIPGHCSGRFAYEDLGSVSQATNCGREVVVVDGWERPMVLTPADPEGFMEALASGETGEFSPADAGDRSLGWRALQGFTVLLMVGLTLLVGRLPVVARSLSYQLSGGRLSAPGLVRPVSMGLSGATARRRVGKGLRRGVRVLGAAMPGLHLGLYRSQGRWVHMATTDLEDIVEVAGERVMVLSPEDPEGFLRALAQAGVRVEAGEG